MQEKIQTAIYGMNFTEVYTVNDVASPFSLTYLPIRSTLYFWRNDVNFQPFYTLDGKFLTIPNLNPGDSIRINYTPSDAVDWSLDSEQNYDLIYQTAKL